MTDTTEIDRNTLPWYKHPYLWFVIIIPFVAVGVGVFYIYKAYSGQDNTVRDDWYMDGKAVEQDLSRDTNASIYGYSAQLTINAARELTADIRSTISQPTPALLFINFYHVAKSDKDRKFTLHQQENGLYTTTLTTADLADLTGKYTLEIDGNNWRLRHDLTMPFEKFNLTADTLDNTSKLVVTSPKP